MRPMMSKIKIKVALVGIAAILVVVSGGCGVKGDPVPPEKKDEIGYGKPKFERATKIATPKRGEDTEGQE